LREGGDGWEVPEPAHDVIVEEVLAGTELSRDDVEPLSDHVDFEALRAVLSGETDETLTADIEGHAVRVESDGTVTVDA
jgi:hypothetical protein